MKVNSIFLGTCIVALMTACSKGPLPANTSTSPTNPQGTSPTNSQGYTFLEVGIRKDSNQINLPNKAVNLVATARIYTPQSITNAILQNVQWSKISGPSSSRILSPNSLTTRIEDLSFGMYVFQCIVTDTAGRKDTATTVVSVNDHSLPEQQIIFTNQQWISGPMNAWFPLNIYQFIPGGSVVRKIFIKTVCDTDFIELFPVNRYAQEPYNSNFLFENNTIMVYIENNSTDGMCLSPSDAPDVKIIY